MQETIYFYRDLNSSDFIEAGREKKIIPVWPKNQYNDSNYIYDESEKKWNESKNLPKEGDDSVFVEFAEFPIHPVKPVFTGNSFFTNNHEIDIEDLSAEEMQDFLTWREKQKRFSYMQVNFCDKEGVSKNYAGAEILVDYKKLTLKLSFMMFDRKPSEEEIVPLSEEPLLKEESIFFDMKNGNLSCNFSDTIYKLDELFSSKRELKKKNLPYQKHEKILLFFREFESKKLPSVILKAAHEKLCLLAQKYTGLSNPPSFRDSVIEDRNTGKKRYLSEMYIFTKLPCEPLLYGILMNKELYDIKFHFRYSRKDTKVLNHFLRKARIKNYRVLRKSFSEHPQVLISYIRLHDAGFKDINLYNRIIESKENIDEINHLERKSLIFFCKKCIKLRGEIPCMNLLLKKTYDEDGDEDFYEKSDAMNMFAQYFDHLPKELVKDILEDGFTKFNHDALSNISYQVENKNIVFKYSPEQEKLEDDIDGYFFRLPKDSYQMCEIGTALHNCVASYAGSVQKKECTIVYAQKDGEYKICIEVREKEIVQERINRNANPGEEEKSVLEKWHDRHGLKE
ncbi:MAG: PcfJ domain-containing protein [Treponema sp.]|nr:PcfJ domain-containing protein [Treponema sp.]